MYVFTAGPGVGEAVAVALPGQGWLALDGCRTGTRFPLAEILIRWRMAQGDSLCAYILTHPHADHADGVPELIETLRPETIGVVASDPPSMTLLCETRLLAGRARATNERLRADVVRAAINAIQGWHEEHPDRLLLLHDGVRIPLASSPAAAHVRAPDREQLARFLDPDGLEDRLRRHANHISAVIELCFGAACVVLGGDLPRFWPSSMSPVRTGWDHVLGVHGHLGAHSMLKVPHHGSREAQHPELMAAGNTVRAWCVTPYNSSRLPRLAVGDGIDLLLDHEPTVHLTAVPASKAVQASQPHPARIPLAQLRRRTELQRTGDPFLDEGTDLRPGDACGPLDAIWCFAVDCQGILRGRWRGRASLEIIRAPSGA